MEDMRKKEVKKKNEEEELSRCLVSQGMREEVMEKQEEGFGGLNLIFEKISQLDWTMTTMKEWERNQVALLEFVSAELDRRFF